MSGDLTKDLVSGILPKDLTTRVLPEGPGFGGRGPSHRSRVQVSVLSFGVLPKGWGSGVLYVCMHVFHLPWIMKI